LLLERLAQFLDGAADVLVRYRAAAVASVPLVSIDRFERFE
jgi:hypothetical protein